MKTIAFIGLGNMGGPMALNLLKAGYRLKVFDLVPAHLESVASAGGEPSASARAAVENVDFVISMLPAASHVERLYLDGEEPGLLKDISSGTIIIDCSTIAVDSAIKLHKAAEKQKLQVLDAPVSGGVAGAKSGNLTFIVGGEAGTFKHSEELLGTMGKNCFHAGAAGAGQIAKICNNMLLAINMTGTAEALKLGTACGLDPVMLSNIMKASSGNNWALSHYNPWPGVAAEVPSSNDYRGGFLVDLMLKDLRLAVATAMSQNTPVPMGELAHSLYSLLRTDAEAGQKDFSSIQKLYVRDSSDD